MTASSYTCIFFNDRATPAIYTLSLHDALPISQAQLDCQRTEQMFAKGAISKADYDRSHTACETTKWSVSAAEARKTMTAEALRDTEIRAPFSGMVVERFVSAGEYVRPDSRVVT